MDIAGTFFQELITVVGYVLLFLVVHKLFQIHTRLTEIKDSLARGTSRPSSPLSAPASPVDSIDYSDATAYAENLLRAVNAESRLSPSSELTSAVPPIPNEPR